LHHSIKSKNSIIVTDARIRPHRDIGSVSSIGARGDGHVSQQHDKSNHSTHIHSLSTIGGRGDGHHEQQSHKSSRPSDIRSLCAVDHGHGNSCSAVQCNLEEKMIVAWCLLLHLFVYRLLVRLERIGNVVRNRLFQSANLSPVYTPPVAAPPWQTIPFPVC